MSKQASHNELADIDLMRSPIKRLVPEVQYPVIGDLKFVSSLIAYEVVDKLDSCRNKA